MIGECKRGATSPRGFVAACRFGIDLNRTFRHKPATCAAFTGGDDLLHDRLGWPNVLRGRAAGGLNKAPETDREKNLSTQQAGSQAPPRLPRPHGDQGWPQGHRRPPGAWPQAPVGLSSRRVIIARLIRKTGQSPCASPV